MIIFCLLYLINEIHWWSFQCQTNLEFLEQTCIGRDILAFHIIAKASLLFHLGLFHLALLYLSGETGAECLEKFGIEVIL